MRPVEDQADIVRILSGVVLAVTFQRDDLGVVDEPVDHCGATTSSPKTSPQRPKGLFDVTMRLARS
jgi:hypothetical protein